MNASESTKEVFKLDSWALLLGDADGRYRFSMFSFDLQKHSLNVVAAIPSCPSFNTHAFFVSSPVF